VIIAGSTRAANPAAETFRPLEEGGLVSG